MSERETEGGTARDVRIVRAAGCRLRVEAGGWPFAEAHAAEIEAHWQARLRESPGFFNGRIHLLTAHAFENGVLTGRLIATDFKSFLFWRETGERDRTVFDAFGSALIRSRDGAVLLGRQRSGNINAGLTYLPGGFIDARDVGPDGHIDLEGSILREVAEETGLRVPLVTVRPGVIVTFTGQQISLAVELMADLDAEGLQERVRAFLISETEPELEAAVLIRSERDLEGLAMPDYARGRLENLFADG